MAKKKPTPRNVRRSEKRIDAKLSAERQAMARALPGGHREHPIEVATASVIEVRALAQACAVCGGELQLDEHRVESDLRVVAAFCRMCGAPRVTYFRVVHPLLH